MSDPAATIIDKLLHEVFKDKRYPSVTCYLLSGLLGIICCISFIAPFTCGFSFLDSIIWKGNWDFAIQFPLIMISAYLICLIIRHCALHTFDVTEKRRKPFVHLFTIVDMIDLLAAAGSLLFMVSAFLQIYKTGEVLISISAMIIYIWVAINFSVPVYIRYANINAKIINDALKRFPDIE